MQNIYFIPRTKIIKRANEHTTGLFYVLEGLSALRNDTSITAIDSTFAAIARAGYLGLSETEKTLLIELRPLIVNLMEQHAKALIPELYTDETKLRIVNAESGLGLQQQGRFMKAKFDLLYKYPALLSTLFNLRPTEELKQNIITIAEASLRLGERELSSKLLNHFTTTNLQYRGQ